MADDDTRPERFATQPGEMKIVSRAPGPPLPVLSVLPVAPAPAPGAGSRARLIADAVLAVGGRRRKIASRDGRHETAFAVEMPAPEGVEDVVLTEAFLSEVAGDAGRTAEIVGRALPALSDPGEVWVSLTPDDEYRRLFVAAFDDGEVVVVLEHPLGALSWTLMSRPEADGFRRGRLLYRREAG